MPWRFAFRQGSFQGFRVPTLSEHSCMKHEDLEAVHLTLSQSRLTPYLVASGGDLAHALDLYSWNLRVAAAFFVDLGTVEVVLRNSIDNHLTARFQTSSVSEPWFKTIVFSTVGEAQVEKALKSVSQKPDVLQSHDDVISQLTLGFWKNLLAKRYQATLWPTMKNAFLNDPNQLEQKREMIFSVVEQMNFLRNRIAHHEPIFNRDLTKQHASMFEFLGSMSLETRLWAESISQTMSVISDRPEL